MSTVPHKHYTEAEYLAVERTLETKHEFFRGEMFAMSGASRRRTSSTRPSASTTSPAAALAGFAKCT